jgi:hypothetical protein
MKNSIDIEYALETAKGIAWDTCHKIYILMDDNQMELMTQYGYDPLIHAKDTTPSEMLATIKKWYKDSCGLRFIDQVATPDKFTSLVPQQFEDEDWRSE